jgi:hypothetical protein
MSQDPRVLLSSRRQPFYLEQGTEFPSPDYILSTSTNITASRYQRPSLLGRLSNRLGPNVRVMCFSKLTTWIKCTHAIANMLVLLRVRHIDRFAEFHSSSDVSRTVTVQEYYL